MERPLSVFGDRSTGEAICSQNVMAAALIANTVKSSLGPVGLVKMLVDDIGDVSITNGGLLELEHPAAKVLCELADLQDKEVGDGTTSMGRPTFKFRKYREHHKDTLREEQPQDT
uniref:Uncharacterized protein n=1 Tax=Gorilla gorilla gorilla TaxID=9595 RepID=A0A2I2Y1T1_GORGO